MTHHITGQKGGKGGGGGQARAAQEDPNTLKSVATARVLDLISEGEIVGLSNGLQSVFLDGVPVENEDGSFNFEGVTVDSRVGIPTQDYIEGFAAVENEVVVDQELLLGVPVARAITDQDIDAVRVKIVIPNLTKQNPENGDLHGASVEFSIEEQLDGGAWSEVVKAKVIGKTTSDYERAYLITRPRPSTSWQLRVNRLSENSDDDATRENQTFWGTYTEIIDLKLSYPDCAIVGLAINAEQFGDKVPRREYDITGRIVQVPSNYDPETRAYTGIWDGTFKPAWTDNPAWCYYDMITHDRYGLGEFIEDFRVDKGRLYQIAQYCDELVDDGFGDVEPRFTLNVQIRTRDEAFTLIRKMASAFRGVTYWGSGSVIPVQDAPADFEHIASPANVINGKFTYGSKSLKNRSTAALVTYNDPNDGEKSAIEVYEDSDAVRVFGWRQKDLVAYGCNSRGLARRVGKWEIESDQNATRTVNYSAALDHLAVRPYSIVAIQDPLIAGVRLSGRVVAAQGNRITLDHLPDSLNLNYDYTIAYINAEGAVVSGEVQSVNLVLNTITWNAPENTYPSPNAMWVMSAPQLEKQLFRVTLVTEQRDNIYSIQAEFYDPNKYARVEQDLQFDDGDFTDLPSGPIPAPKNLRVSDYLVRRGTTFVVILTASVTPTNDPRATFIQFQIKPTQSDGWLPGQLESEPYFEYEGVRDGDVISVRSRTISRLGLQSVWVESVYTVLGKSAPPAPPQNFTAVLRPDTGVFLSKDPSPDADYRETRFFVGTTFDTAIEIARISGNTHLWDHVTAGTLTFWCIDYDTEARASAVASVELVVNVPGTPSPRGVFEADRLQLSWELVSSDFVIAEFQILREGVLVGSTRATSFALVVDWLGVQSFDVVAVDIAGNVSDAGQVSAEVLQPAQPMPVVAFTNNVAVLSWPSAKTTLPIVAYRIQYEDELLGEVSALSFNFSPNFQGSRILTVEAIDSAGNASLNGEVEIGITPPKQPSLAFMFEGRDVRITWRDVAATLPIRAYRIYRDNVLADEVSAESFLAPVDWQGDQVFGVVAVDWAGNISVEGAIVVDPNSPAAPVVDFAFDGPNVVFSVQSSPGSLPIDRIIIRKNSAVIAQVDTDSFSLLVDWQGNQDFEFIVIDSSGQQSAASLVTVVVNLPDQPVISGVFVDGHVQLSWPDIAGSLPVSRYVIDNGGERIEVTQPNYNLTVDFKGARIIPVVAFDSAGNTSEAGIFEVVPSPPLAPVVRTAVIDNTVTFYYRSVPGSLPIQSYELRRADTFNEGDPFESKSGDATFTTQQELQAGIYTFQWIARDTGGNISEPTAVTAAVSQPPDYVLLADWSEREEGWTGTKENCFVDSQNRLVVLANTTETWQEHFRNNNFASPQAQIDAGFERYLQPSTDIARYTIVHDYGAVLNDSLISIVSAPQTLDGNVVESVQLAFSEDGNTYISAGLGERQIRGSNFRYVRAVVTYTAGGGDDLVVVSDIQIKLDKKLVKDAGKFQMNASDANGTFVPFTLAFLDANVPNVKLNTTEIHDIIVDFLDQPNPEGFRAYAVRRSDGKRLSGPATWDVNGFGRIG